MYDPLVNSNGRWKDMMITFYEYVFFSFFFFIWWDFRFPLFLRMLRWLLNYFCVQSRFVKEILIVDNHDFIWHFGFSRSFYMQSSWLHSKNVLPSTIMIFHWEFKASNHHPCYWKRLPFLCLYFHSKICFVGHYGGRWPDVVHRASGFFHSDSKICFQKIAKITSIILLL